MTDRPLNRWVLSTTRTWHLALRSDEQGWETTRCHRVVKARRYDWSMRKPPTGKLCRDCMVLERKRRYA